MGNRKRAGSRRLNTENKLYTPKSGTTVYIDYLEKNRILEIEFTKGEAYHYFDVEPDVWVEYRDLINEGKSSGAYANFVIKPNYEFEKIT